MVTNTLSLLAFLASPVFVAILSTQAEKWQWFQSISPNGKLSIIGGFSVLLAILSLAAQNALGARPDVLAALDPYVIIALPIINFVVSQMTHGTQTARSLGK